MKLRLLGSGASREHLTVAIGIFESLGDQRELARARLNLGTLRRAEGDIDAAVALHLAVIEYCTDREEAEGLFWALTELARDEHARGECDTARRHWDDAHRLVHRNHLDWVLDRLNPLGG